MAIIVRESKKARQVAGYGQQGSFKTRDIDYLVAIHSAGSHVFSQYQMEAMECPENLCLRMIKLLREEYPGSNFRVMKTGYL